MINTLDIFQSKRFTRAMTCVTGRLHLTKNEMRSNRQSFWDLTSREEETTTHFWPSFLSSIQIKQEAKSTLVFENDPLN
jgi:hypothetical protein